MCEYIQDVITFKPLSDYDITGTNIGFAHDTSWCAEHLWNIILELKGVILSCPPSGHSNIHNTFIVFNVYLAHEI